MFSRVSDHLSPAVGTLVWIARADDVELLQGAVSPAVAIVPDGSTELMRLAFLAGVNDVLTGDTPPLHLLEAVLSQDRVTPGVNQPPDLERLTDALCHRRAEDGFGAVDLEVCRDLWALMSNPDCSIRDVTNLISGHAVLGAQVLQVANSAAWAGSQQARTVRDACVRLGTRQLLSIAQQVMLRPAFDVDPGWVAKLLKQLWQVTRTTAACAASLARSARHPDPEMVRTAALLHNIGEVVLLREFRRAAVQPSSRADAIGWLAQKHEEVGAAALSAWGAPVLFTQIARSHHNQDPTDSAPHAAVRNLVMLAWEHTHQNAQGRANSQARTSPLLSATGLTRAQLEHAFDRSQRLMSSRTGNG